MSKEIKKYNCEFTLKVVMGYMSGNFTAYKICSKYDVAKLTLHK